MTRVTADQKALLQRAAALQGRSLTDFIVSSAQEAAVRVIDDYEVITLGSRDSQAFVQGLLDPPPVSDRLRDTIERFRAITGR